MKNILLWFQRRICNYKYKFVDFIPKSNVNVLEIGIGNNSPKIFKKLYPNYVYHGIDRNLDYNLDKESIRSIDRFFELDLEMNNLQQVPNNYYDFIIASNVIEHVERGEEIVDLACSKISNKGYFYIEYPREESKKFPSMKGTLNFYDDVTHKRSYDIERLREIFIKNGFAIIRYGVKRDVLRIIGIPFMIIKSIIQLGYIRGSVFWDLLGFANYILAKRIE